MKQRFITLVEKDEKKFDQEVARLEADGYYMTGKPKVVQCGSLVNQDWGHAYPEYIAFFQLSNL